MKWSVCSTGYRDKPVEYVIGRAVEWGLDGVELWVGHIDDYAARHGSTEGLVRSLREAGLRVPCISPYTYFSKGEEERRESLRQIEAAIGYARQFDAPLVRTFLGHLPSREATPALWKETMDGLKRALATAERHRVTIGLELHNHTFADTIDSIRAILAEADHPFLGVIFDGFNLYVEREDMLDALKTFYPRTVHVHMKNYRWDFHDRANCVPTLICDGDVDNKGALEYLLRNGYDGFVSLEYFGEAGEICSKRSFEWVKNRFNR